MFLTTPMKKIAVYAFALFLMFLLLRIGYHDYNKVPQLELDKGFKESPINTMGNIPGNGEVLSNINANSNTDANSNSKKKVTKEQFNNEVAKQQEVKNLEKEYKQQPAHKGPIDKEIKNKIDI